MNESRFGTRDGFQLLKDDFTLPNSTSRLDLKTRHAVKICSFFLSEKLSIDDIADLLQQDRGIVIRALLDQGIIQDRRKQARESPD